MQDIYNRMRFGYLNGYITENEWIEFSDYIFDIVLYENRKILKRFKFS